MLNRIGKPAQIFSYLISAISVVFGYLIATQNRDAFWDFDVYARASHDFLDASNAYSTSGHLPFIYHPYVLFVFGALAKIGILEIATIIFCVASGWLFIWAMLDRYTKAFLPIMSLSLGVSVSGAVALASGNLTFWLHIGLIGFYLWSDKRNKSLWWFIGLVVAAALIKPYLFLYLALMWPKLSLIKVAIRSAIAGLVLAGIWFSALITCTPLYEQFVKALKYQTLKHGDLGVGVMGLVKPISGRNNAFIAFVIVALVAAVLLLVVWRNQEDLLPRIVIVIALANPRLKEYEIPVVLMMLGLILSKVNLKATWQAFVVILAVADIAMLDSLRGVYAAFKTGHNHFTPMAMQPMFNWALICGLAVFFASHYWSPFQAKKR